MSEARSPSEVRSTTVGIVYWLIASQSHPPLRPGGTDVLKRLDDPVDHPVLPCLLRREPPVPVAVPGDRLLALPGVLGRDPLHRPLHELQVLGLDLDVGYGPPDPRRRLMHHDPGVRQCAALALGADREQELAHA